MNEIFLGIAPINWSNDDMPELGGETSLEQCLQEMRAAGYAGTELGHKFPRDPSLLAPIMASHELTLCSAWHSTYFANRTSWESEKERLEKTLNFLSRMGAKRINIAEGTRTIHGEKTTPLALKPVLTEEEWQNLVEGLHAAALLCHQYGIQLCYHHHMGTVIQTQAEITRLMDATRPDLVFLCADTGHLQMAGIDPHWIFQTYGARIRHIHLKDVRQNILLELCKGNLDSSTWNFSFLQAVLRGVFTVPGQGIVDYPQILKTILHKDKMNYHGWMVIEAEGDPELNPPLPLARQAALYLKTLCSQNAQLSHQLSRQLSHGPSPSKMHQTQILGSDFWNDSCDPEELEKAVLAGAVGATSNPLIVATTLKGHPLIWGPVIDSLREEFPRATEDDLAWKLITTLAKQGARILEPIFHSSDGKKGKLSLQVNPKFYAQTDLMVEQGKILGDLAPNLCLKIPATTAGIQAMEELTALGYSVNATVSFSYSQVKAALTAMEKGLLRGEQSGRDMKKVTPYITLMVGRLDDHLKRVMESEKITTDPGLLNWAGIAVFKKCYAEIFNHGQRKTPVTLLVAAFRHHLHWSQLVGGKIVFTIPFAWWNQFNASSVKVENLIDQPVPPEVIEELLEKFPDFQKAYCDQSSENENEFKFDFDTFGPTIHTLQQFLEGQDQLICLIRERMLKKGPGKNHRREF